MAKVLKPGVKPLDDFVFKYKCPHCSAELEVSSSEIVLLDTGEASWMEEWSTQSWVFTCGFKGCLQEIRIKEEELESILDKKKVKYKAFKEKIQSFEIKTDLRYNQRLWYAVYDTKFGALIARKRGIEFVLVTVSGSSLPRPPLDFEHGIIQFGDGDKCDLPKDVVRCYVLAGSLLNSAVTSAIDQGLYGKQIEEAIEKHKIKFF